MALNCEIIPTVKFANSSRQPEESKLFKSLLSYAAPTKAGGSSRDVAVELYNRYKNTAALLQQYGDRLNVNDQDQIRFGDLLRETDALTYMDSDKISKAIEKSLGEKISSDTTENYINAIERINAFNNNSEFAGAFVATISREADSKGNRNLRISIHKYSDEIYEKAQESIRAYDLNSRIREILYNSGVSVQAYDKLLGGLALGMTDFAAAKTASNGLIELIKLAKGSIGEAVLLEEFSHFVLECMNDNPLAQRLIKLVKTEGLASVILGDLYSNYYDEYNGNEDMLAFEAASDLIRDVIFENKVLDNPSLDRLSERLKMAFSSKFSGLDEQYISSIINEAVNTAEKISSYALESSRTFNTNVIKSTKKFLAISSREAKMKKLLQDTITDSYKSFRIQKLTRIVAPENELAVQTQDEARKQYLKQLETYLNSEDNKILNFSFAIMSVITDANRELDSYYNWFEKQAHGMLAHLDEYPINEIATFLTNAKNMADYYESVLTRIQQFYTNMILNEPDFPTTINSGDTTINIREELAFVLEKIRKVNNVYQNAARPVFIRFMKNYFGEDIEVPFSDALNLLIEDENNPGRLRKVKKGEKISVETFVKNAVKDIGMLNRWFSSMANSGDFINKLFSKAVEETKTIARTRAQEFETELKAAALKAKDAGVTDFEWLFERDDEGTITYNFIRPVNYGQCKKDRIKFKADFKEKTMGGKPYTEWTPDEKLTYKNALTAWDNVHRPYDFQLKKRIPSSQYYANPEYTAMASNPAKFEFYTYITSKKAELDSYLPNGQYAANRAPIIMKDIVEVIKDRGLGVAIANKVQAAKDYAGNLSDRLGFGMHESQLDDEMDEGDEDIDTNVYGKIKLVDFNGKPIDMLPIHYQKARKEIRNKDGKVICKADDPNDLSTDIVSTMTAYADMAIRYHEMNKVINALMMCKNYADENQVIAQTDGDKPVIERIRRSSDAVVRAITKDNSKSNIVGQRNDFFEAQVFERWFANEGTIKLLGISKAQAANILNKVTSLNGLALNTLAGIANVEQGVLVMNVEAFARQFFDEKDLAKADLDYFTKYLPQFIAEIGSNLQVSEMALWSKKFNVLQSYDREIRDINFEHSRMYRLLLGSDSLYLMNNIGEHWMQHRTFFALAESDEMVLHDADGNEVKLIDAFSRKFIQKDGSLGDTDAGLGAKLVMKTGLYDHHGRRIITIEEAENKKLIKTARGFRGYSGDTIPEQLYIDYVSRKCAEINHKMHGIYNTEDMNAAQRYAIGRMALIFRKWIAPSIQKRYGQATFNFDLDEWTEGYYNTAFKFLWKLIKDCTRLELNYHASYEELSDVEKANIRRAITEVVEFTSILGGLLLLDWNDTTNSPWAIQMLEWSLYRMRTEMGALMPTPYLVTEGIKLFRSPTADIQTLEKAIHLLGCLMPTNWAFDDDDLIQSGKFEGHSYAYKYFMESPIVMFYNDFVNLSHPEYVVPFYKSAFGSYGSR